MRGGITRPERRSNTHRVKQVHVDRHMSFAAIWVQLKTRKSRFLTTTQMVPYNIQYIWNTHFQNLGSNLQNSSERLYEEYATVSGCLYHEYMFYTNHLNAYTTYILSNVKMISSNLN